MTTAKMIAFPQTQEDWDSLPSDFLIFLDRVDEARGILEAKDPAYYCWNVDSELSLRVLIESWNSDGNSADISELIEDISEGLAQDACISYEQARVWG